MKKSLASAMLFSLFSCTNLESTSIEQGGSSHKCPQWENPQVNPNLPVIGSHPDLQNVPEGLTLLGADGKPTSQLDCSKPTLVYITGRSPKGVGEFFRNPTAWTQKFNVFMFRWHRLGLDSQRIPLKSLNNTPSASKKLTPQLVKLIEILRVTKNSQEFRIVSHSLGGIILTKSVHEVLDSLQSRPLRAELLDPAFLLYDVRESIPDIPFVSPEIVNEMKFKLKNMTTQNVKVVVYPSAHSIDRASKLSDIANVQAMNPLWLGGNTGTRHDMVREFYFNSFSQKKGLVSNPELGMSEPFSALYPTSAIPKSPKKLVQVQGESTVDISDDTFQIIP